MKIGEIFKIIGEILKIGKSTAKGIQISGDLAMARRIKKAIAEGDTVKLRKIVERGGILVDGKDIHGVFKHATKPAVLVSVDLMVNYIQMKKMIKRYQRQED